MAVAKSIITSNVQKDFSRRGLLAALPAAGAALALPASGAAAPAEGDTPMKAAYRTWLATYDRLAHLEGAAFDAAYDELGRIEDQMAALPVHGAADVLALLAAQTRWGELGDHVWQERLPAGALAVVKRALA